MGYGVINMSKYDEKWFRRMEIFMAIIAAGLIIAGCWYMVSSGALDSVLHGILW